MVRGVSTDGNPIFPTLDRLPSYLSHIFVFLFPGFVIEGFDIEHSAGSSQTVLSKVNSLLPAGKPRFIHGMGSPGQFGR